MNTNVRYIIPVLIVLALTTAAYAGGWAVITLSEFPDYGVAGKPLNLSFTVRQHGVTLLSDLKPTVIATKSGGRTASAPVTAGKAGEYKSALTLPETGDWTIKITSGFMNSETTLPPLRVIADSSPVPAAFAPATRGLRLFTAKGCIGCHRHLEVNPTFATDAKFDLTTRRFPPDYLKRFLADPSIKPADMPNLNLKPDEIDALSAFINKYAEKVRAGVRP